MVTRRKRGTVPMRDGIPVMEGVDMNPTEDPADFWGPNWKAEMEEAERNIANGNVRHFDSTEEFLAALRAIPASDANV